MNKRHRLTRASSGTHLAQQAQRGRSQLRVLCHAQRVPVGPALKHLRGQRKGNIVKRNSVLEHLPAPYFTQHMSTSLTAGDLHAQQQQRRALSTNSIHLAMRGNGWPDLHARKQQHAGTHPAIKAVPRRFLGKHACHCGRLLERLQHVLSNENKEET